MIYFYKSISPQNIENLQIYLHHFFNQLFSGVHPNYDHNNFIDNDFEEIINEYKLQIDDNLEAIFNAYQVLTLDDKNLLQTAYNNNNNIKDICSGVTRPYKYDELPLTLVTPIKNLYGSTGVLWSMLTAKKGYEAIKNKCGDLKNHFERFRVFNHFSVCPFCGMENLLNEYDTLKNEYDHYIPKGKYPFCSINFSNLVPTCDYCNGAGNKGQKDIPFTTGIIPLLQRPLYFPYETEFLDHEIVLSIAAPSTDLKDINSWSLEFNCFPVLNTNLMKAWKDIYNIESRYKSKIAKDNNKWKDKIVKKYHFWCVKQGNTFDNLKTDCLNDFF